MSSIARSTPTASVELSRLLVATDAASPSLSIKDRLAKARKALADSDKQPLGREMHQLSWDDTARCLAIGRAIRALLDEGDDMKCLASQTDHDSNDGPPKKSARIWTSVKSLIKASLVNSRRKEEDREIVEALRDSDLPALETLSKDVMFSKEQEDVGTDYHVYVRSLGLTVLGSLQGADLCRLGRSFAEALYTADIGGYEPTVKSGFFADALLDIMQDGRSRRYGGTGEYDAEIGLDKEQQEQESMQAAELHLARDKRALFDHLWSQQPLTALSVVETLVKHVRGPPPDEVSADSSDEEVNGSDEEAYLANEYIHS